MTSHKKISNKHNASPEKFRALVYFFIEQCKKNPDKLGTIRLNKALWFTDVAYYLWAGEQMTNSSYVRRKFGPVPKHILRVLAELEDENAITIHEPMMQFDVRHFVISKENKKIEFVDSLSKEEEKFAKAILDRVLGHSASEISELTHDELWRETPDGEEMLVREAARRIQATIFAPEAYDAILERA